MSKKKSGICIFEILVKNFYVKYIFKTIEIQNFLSTKTFENVHGFNLFCQNLKLQSS